MKLFSCFFLTLFIAGISFPSFGDEAPKGKDEHKHDEHENHGSDEHEREEHDHKEEHGHDEGGAIIGPDKGITEKGPLGIKISAEAVKTIKPMTIPWTGGNLTIPYKALVRIKDSKSIFRLRGGWYKRISTTVQSRMGENVRVEAQGLQVGDQIVISNVGFLRMAEVIAEEGAVHSH